MIIKVKNSVTVRVLALCIVILLGIIPEVFSQRRYWKFPPQPSPERYGNILIDRATSGTQIKAATFSHWSHRVLYTCRACHTELGFKLALNTTLITEDANKNGKYCGACHDGKTAFGHTGDNCDKCHNGDIDYGREKFDTLSHLPSAAYGNYIDWVDAVEEKLITPRTYVKDNRETFTTSRKMTITPKWRYVLANAIFSHEVHGKWLGCTNCHPEIFAYEFRKTENLRMLNNLKGEYCGTCHGKVSFPLIDCRRCHPDIHF